MKQQKINDSSFEKNYLQLNVKIEKLSKAFNILQTSLEKHQNQLKIYHEENMNRLDQVVGELATMRDENTIGTYQISELREGHLDHEKRIIKLEKLPHTS